VIPGLSAVAGGGMTGGAAGPSSADSGNISFGNFGSGGQSAGFNPFVSPQSSNAKLLMIGALVLGGFWILKKK